MIRFIVEPFPTLIYTAIVSEDGYSIHRGSDEDSALHLGPTPEDIDLSNDGYGQIGNAIFTKAYDGITDNPELKAILLNASEMFLYDPPGFEWTVEVVE